MPKKRVLIIYRCYFPSQSHSGPATAIRNLVTNMAGDYDFHILTLNHDFSTGQALFSGQHHLMTTPHAVVEYVPRGLRSIFILAQRLRENFDIIDIQCAFDPLLAIPALAFHKLGFAKRSNAFHTPHGIFMETIMSARTWRKRLFCWAADFFGLYRNVTHLAGSSAEMRDIQRNHRAWQRVHVMSQFVETPTKRQTVRTKPKSRLKVAFVGRVAPQKNLIFAIQTMCKLRVPSTLDIFGDIGDQTYAALCHETMQHDTGLCHIRFMGGVEKDVLFRNLQNYDVLLHPTLGENFGHAIVESLHLGLPVLISDRTPWIDVNDCHAGWSLPLSHSSAFAEKLEAIYAMSDEWSQLSSGAVEYANRVFDREDTSNRYRAAYG